MEKGGKIGEIEFPRPVNWGAIAMHLRNFSFFLPTVVRRVPTALSCKDWYVETFYLRGKKSDRKREKEKDSALPLRTFCWV